MVLAKVLSEVALNVISDSDRFDSALSPSLFRFISHFRLLSYVYPFCFCNYVVFVTFCVNLFPHFAIFALKLPTCGFGLCQSTGAVVVALWIRCFPSFFRKLFVNVLRFLCSACCYKANVRITSIHFTTRALYYHTAKGRTHRGVLFIEQRI